MIYGREKVVLAAIAQTILEEEPAWTPAATRDLVARAERHMASCTASMRWMLRLAILAFEWGGLFLRTMDNRFEHFVRMPPKARRRYLRFWLNHRRVALRDVAFLLKTLVLSFAFDDPARAHRKGFAPSWWS